VKHVVGIAIVVARSAALTALTVLIGPLACVRPPPSAQPPGEGAGGAWSGGGGGGAGGTSTGGGTLPTGGANGVAGASGGAGGSPIPETCVGHDIDISSGTLAGALTIGGAPATADPSTRLLLRNGLNDLVEIPIAADTYSVRVAPGRYDVFYSATAATAGLLNRLARLHEGIMVAAGAPTVLDVDVPATKISGVVTINGAGLAAGDTVSLSLRNAAGDSVPLAVGSDGSYSARVVPGTFDLSYAAGDLTPGSATPANQLALLASGVVIAPARPTTLDVNVRAATVAGNIAINGVPAGPTNRGKVYLKNAAGDTVRLAVANAGAYTARVVPGRYDLYFSGTEDAYSVANQNTRLRTGVVVAAGGTTLLDVEVPSAAVTGTLRLDGAAPDATDSVHLLLRNAAGDSAPIPWSIDGHYSMRAVPGTYDLYYSKDNRSPARSPTNQLAKLRAGIVVAAGATTVLDIDVTSSLVMGAVTINGLPAAAGFNSGIVTLRSADGDRAQIASAASAAYAARVVPGTYDLYYTRIASPTNTTTEAPANHAARLRTAVVIAPGATTVFDIDIPSTTVTGMITVNGATAGAGDTGRLMLQNAAGDFAPFASTNADTYTARLVPGTYDLYFSNAGSVGDTTPMNTLSRLRCFTVP
jgi:hypothetical protein